MPHFFFHVYNGHGEVADDVGTDLENQTAARRLAIDSIRSMIAEDARRGMIDLQGRIEVADDGSNVLVVIEFVEAFELRLPEALARPQ